MKIQTITIKNVRGIRERAIQLGMIPNKPSILVAPNGSGKSSFAFAFQWLNQARLKLDPDNAYDNDINNKPELAITTDEDGNKTYCADENKNEVGKRFGIFVINNGLTAATPRIHGGMLTGKAHITVPTIEILNVKCDSEALVDDFDDVYQISAPVGMFPVVSTLFNNNRFMSLLEYDCLKMTARPMKKLMDILDLIKSYQGTIPACHQRISDEVKSDLESFPQIIYVVGVLRNFLPDDSDVKLLLKALRIVTLAYRKKDLFKSRIKYAQFKLNEENIRRTFGLLNNTWKDIKPHREGDKVILKIGDAQRISNGERDILLLIGRLLEARTKLVKKDNILIIDEVFDYLDDANLIAAQHYINMFISDLHTEGKNIYPIILSHINPSYYRTFAFRNMKVYYLNALQNPHASDNMLKLVRRREELERSDKAQADLISKYMLHFYKDYSYDMSSIINMDDPKWGDVARFKAYCLKQLEKYLEGENYDALAVCVALREMIEKYCYSLLRTDEHRTNFLDETNGTENKIDYCESLNFTLPDTFSLLGLIYNDPLHQSNKNQIDLRQTLYSRLENNTIKVMIEEIKHLFDGISE